MELALIIAVSILGLLLIGSNLYWALVNDRLVNKLMSRNYADYQVATTLTEKKNDKIVQPQDYHPEDLGNLTEVQF